ncbi:MAG: TolC family protein [Myxococcaceae bacterium]|jgi:cobalt-zinc-cadmium efflux system outer membrane protein|nr:TolC family protein [Myxococcaceae bacterium]MCA3011985.1 TolC family protein [Myxococcaceae bacterium]
MTLVWVVGLVSAQALSFDEALALAETSPALEGQRRALERQARLAADVPVVVANPAVFIQPGVRRASSGAFGPEAYLGVSQDVSLSGAGVSRAQSARAEVEAAALGRGVTRRQLRLDVAGAWLSVWSAQASLAAAREEARLAKDWAAKVERGATSGGFTRVDVAVARAWLAEAALTALSLEGELFTRGVALNRALGRPRTTPARAASALPDLGPVEREPPPLPEDVSTTLPVRLAVAEAEAQRRRANELLAGRGASLQVGAMGWREGVGDIAAVATLQLTLPLFERAQRERAVAEAAVARAEAATDGARADELAERTQAHHELEHTTEVLTVLEAQLLPATLEAAAGIERRFDAGEATAQELVLARRTLVAARGRRVSALAESVLARFRWRELTREAP